MVGRTEILVSPEASEAKLDIVFVHGLNPTGNQDHARTTWTHKDGTFWPQHLLPELLPSARILLFEYNSSVLRNASNASVAAHAQSLLNDVKNMRLRENEKHLPLIFVAHSLGGVLVKQALIEATINRTYRCLHASTYGLVFFATPHLGGNKAGAADVAAKIGSVISGEPTNSLLAILKKGSLVNEISSDQFRHQVNRYEILTFYETKPMSLKVKGRRFFPQFTSMEVVGRESAKLKAERETALELDRNHSEICKFSRDGDEAFERVGRNLRVMASEAETYQVECSHAPPKICTWGSPPFTVKTSHHQTRLISEAIAELGGFRSNFFSNNIVGAVPARLGIREPKHRINLPKQCDPFVGRKELVSHIQDAWKTWDGPSQRRLCLSGLGGVGKTELSRFIVDKLGPRRHILWLRATDHKALQGDLFDAAIALKNDLVRFESTKDSTNNSEEDQAFYYSAPSSGFLMKSLEIWLRTARDDDSRILLVLDDLDGLEAERRQELSRSLPGDSIDLIFTTRDPLIAELGMSWDATQFHVPPLLVDPAIDLLLSHMKRNRAAKTPVLELTSDRERGERLVTCLGPLPSAIINGSHYLKDKLAASTGNLAFDQFLVQWSLDGSKGPILSSRRTDIRYQYSIKESFAVSISRLRRNTTDSDIVDLYDLCLCMVRLLSMMNISEIHRRQFHKFPEYVLPRTAPQMLFVNQPTERPDIYLWRLTHDYNLVNSCLVELKRVSMLSEPGEDSVVLLNTLVRDLVLLAPANISFEEKAGLQRVAAMLG